MNAAGIGGRCQQRRQGDKGQASAAPKQQQRTKKKKGGGGGGAPHRGQGHKKLRDSRVWRYVDVNVPRVFYDARMDGDEVVWPESVPFEETWNAFFAQTDPRRQLRAAVGLVKVLLELPLSYITTHWGTLGDLPVFHELVAWIEARLRPALRHQRRAASHHSVQEEEGDGQDDKTDKEKRGARTSTSSRRNKREHRKECRADAELEVQIKALEIVAALSVLLGATHPHHFFAGLAVKATPSSSSPPPRSAARSGKAATACRLLEARKTGRSKTRAADTDDVESQGPLGDTLMRVIGSVKKGGDKEAERVSRQRRMWRSRMRMEAMRSLAVVCFIIDDASITSEACRFVAECYLAHRQVDDIEALWRGCDSQSDSEQHDDINEEERESESEDDELNCQDCGEIQGSDGDDDSDEEEESSEASDFSEEKEEEEDDDDDEECEEESEGSEEEDMEGETKQRGNRRGRRVCDIPATERAEALRVWGFLASLLTDDKEVCAVVGPHKLPLIEMLLVADSEEEGDDEDLEGASLRRVQAADALVIWALSSNDDHRRRRSGNEEEPTMTDEDKRRLLALCVNKARGRGGRRGERVRGVERRAWAKSEQTSFRQLAVQLIHAGVGGHTSKKTSSRREEHARSGPGSEASELGLAGSRSLKAHVTYRAHVRNPVWWVLMNELSGWRWSRILTFLERYFGSDFWTMLKTHRHVREAAKILPPGTEGPNYTWPGRLRLVKVNKASFEGRTKQTKRYRRMISRNMLHEDHYGKGGIDRRAKRRERQGIDQLLNPDAAHGW